MGPVPFGYRTVQPGGVPQVVEEEGEAVRESFARRARGESTGAIANWLNGQDFKTRKGGVFISHAVKDMLNCRFYLGKIEYDEQEYPGQHQAIISEDLYQAAQARKQNRDNITRRVAGPKGALQGMIACGECGNRLQSDRHRLGGAMYRERHSHPCATNGRSIMAHRVDAQVKSILTAVELQPRWREQMARLAVANRKGPSPEDLLEKKRRLARAYADGAFTDREYEAKLAEIENQLRLTKDVGQPNLEEAADLFENISELWEEATPEERRRLISPLIERVYVDMESSAIGAFVPAPAFRRLLAGALTRADSAAALLLSEDDTERLEVWSWWRRGRVELSLHTYLRVLVAA